MAGPVARAAGVANGVPVLAGVANDVPVLGGVAALVGVALAAPGKAVAVAEAVTVGVAPPMSVRPRTEGRTLSRRGKVFPANSL